MQQRGIVKFYHERGGYGMITLEDGREAFVSGAALKSRGTALEAGQGVWLDVVEGPKGPEARNVFG
jgi:cold shock CspA family protein